MSKKKPAQKDIDESSAVEKNTEAIENETTASEPSIEEKINVLQGTVDDLNDKLLRLTAEYQNYRKRVEKEKSDIFKYGNEKLFLELITIMDTFERAMAAANTANVGDKFLEGLNLIKRAFEEVFERNGVQKITAVGEAFNHDYHHAVVKESKDGVESDIVLEVLQEGYLLSDRVIRPSMVKVSE